MQKIKSITEAFSMQPQTLHTVKKSEGYYDEKQACKEIKLENIHIGYVEGNPIDEMYYAGYNFDGQRIFQYLAKSVNVHFETV